MTLKRKLGIAATLAAVLLALTLCWPKPKGYTYQDKTVEEWFEKYSHECYAQHPNWGIVGEAAEAFRAMGTNAVPFLVNRINRDRTPSRLEIWTSKLPGRFQDKSKVLEAHSAASLINACIKPPRGMLSEMLKPALLSTNAGQRFAAGAALRLRPPALEIPK